MRIIIVFLFSISSFSAISLLDLNNESGNLYFSEPNNRIDRPVKVLRDLKDEINAHYGFKDGGPRINSGPCGRFAYLFYQKWNKTFTTKVVISFVMSADSSECYHVLIKLPNNHYYDGGNGELKRSELLKRYQEETYIVDMIEFDFELLNEMSYGLDRQYDRCPNYSDEVTTEIIEKHLNRIKRGRI